MIEKSLTDCHSDIEASYTCWKCKTEPAICPPHGMQTKTCMDSCNILDGKPASFTQKISCSPGVCSGCYIPRWFGDEWSNNVCISYGTRFEQTIGTEEKTLTERVKEVLYTNDGDYSLEIVSPQNAILTLFSRNGTAYVYNLN